jgi:hypothetical protein
VKKLINPSSSFVPKILKNGSEELYRIPKNYANKGRKEMIE